MVTTSLRLSLLAAMTIASAGCFDVSGGQGAPLLIDDFDHGTALPVDRHFDQWRCGRFEPGSKQYCSCTYDDRTYGRNPSSIHLHAEVEDTLDEKRSFGGAQLYTQAVVPEDLSHMSRIAFSAMFAPIPLSISTGAILYVELYCSLAPATGTSADDKLHVQHSVDYPSTEEWRSYTIDLSEKNFTVPTNYKGTGIKGGLTACLKLVDGIHFSVNAQLRDGQSGTVDLHIDDVYFE